MKLVGCLPSLIAVLITTVCANTEKAIFLGPAASSFKDSLPRLDHLKFQELSPTTSSLTKSLPAAFPTDQQPYGLETWYLLRDLKAGQRYEVRICWAAIQPTTFCLDTFDIVEVASHPARYQSVGEDSGAQREKATELSETSQESALLLRVRAAADFFTTNQTLMQHPPNVDVDIILDPFVANIFPASLVWTAAYITILAVGSWYISGFIWSRLNPPTGDTPKAHVD